MTQGKVLNRLTEMHLTFYTKAFVGDDTPEWIKVARLCFDPFFHTNVLQILKALFYQL